MTREQRFDPMREIQNISEQVGKQLERGIRSITGPGEQLAVDMYQADGELVVRTGAIDGLIKESIEISLEGDELTISLHTEPEATPTHARYLLQERRFGGMTRTLDLPMAVIGEEASAKVDKSMRLVVTLPLEDSAYGKIKVTPVE